MKDISLVIKAPEQGIAQSPHVGFADVRNLDLDTNEGTAQLNNILAKVSGTTVTGQINWFVRNPITVAQFYAVDSNGLLYQSTTSGASWSTLTGNTHTFTVTVASPAVFSATAHGFTTNDQVVFTTTGALPTGLSANTIYYIISAGLTADAFEVSATRGGAAINTSGTQSGTHSFLTNGAGLAIWKDYLFAPRASSIDVYGPLSGTPSWTTNWKKIDMDNLWHPLLVSKLDSKLYGGAGRYIFTLAEVAGQTFAPGSSGTFTFTQQALTLPPNYRIKCLEELGNNLMIGTWQGVNIYDIRIGDIFTWNGSATTYGQPIVLSEFGVHAMLNTGNSLVVLAGLDGTIFRCDGVYAIPIAQLPMDLSGGKYIEWYPGGICNYKNKVFFGVGQGGTAAIPAMGVYSLRQTSRGNSLLFEHTVSTLNDGTTNPLKPSALIPVTRDTLLLAWRDNATYGIDLTTATSYAYSTNYSGYFDSPLYVVGDINNPVTFLGFDLSFGKKLATGEGVQIQFRTSLSDSFTTIGTYDYATLGAVISHTAPCGIPSCQVLQVRVLLLGTSTTTPAFKSLKLINYSGR